MFNKMNVKNGSKDLKRYPQISRRVRDTLARLYTACAAVELKTTRSNAQEPQPDVNIPYGCMYS